MMSSRQNFDKRYFQTDDQLRLYYRDYSLNGLDQPPILCLHGLTRNSKDFDDIAEHLAKTRRVIVPDLRGRGQSEYDEEWQNYHPHTYVNDAWMLLSHLNVHKVIVIGTSLGGLMAMIMAAQNSEKLHGVVLNDIGPELAHDGIARIMSYVGDAQADYSFDEAIARISEVNSIYFPDFVEKDWRNFVLRTHKVNGNNRYELEYDPQIFTALTQLGGLPEDPWNYFNALNTVSCLLLHGELSDLLTPDIVEKMCSKKPDLQYEKIPRCGHAPFLNEPKSLQAIDTFLQQLS